MNMMIKLPITTALVLLTAAALALLAAGSAGASTIYTYTGNNFLAVDIIDSTPPAGTYTTSMHVSGSFTLANPLPANLPFSIFTPLSFSFSDGRNTITDANNTSFVFAAATDALGNFSSWNVRVTNSVVLSSSETLFLAIGTGFDPTSSLLPLDEGRIDDSLGIGLVDIGSVADLPGTWTVTTPLPAALPLFATGLIGLVLLGWRRKRKASSV